jgi:hypothetical protein
MHSAFREPIIELSIRDSSTGFSADSKLQQETRNQTFSHVYPYFSLTPQKSNLLRQRPTIGPRWGFLELAEIYKVASIDRELKRFLGLTDMCKDCQDWQRIAELAGIDRELQRLPGLIESCLSYRSFDFRDNSIPLVSISCPAKIDP